MDLALPNILPDVLTSSLHSVIHLLIQQECTESLPGSYTVWELPLCASLILAFSDVPSIPWLVEISCLTLAQCISLTDVQVGPVLGLFHVGRIRIWENVTLCLSKGFLKLLFIIIIFFYYMMLVKGFVVTVSHWHEGVSQYVSLRWGRSFCTRGWEREGIPSETLIKAA